MASAELQTFIDQHCPGLKPGDPAVTLLLLEKIQQAEQTLKQGN